MKRKHILSVTLIVCIIYLPFLLGLLHLMVINLNSSHYIILDAIVKQIEMNYSRAVIVTVEYQVEQEVHQEEVSHKIGDYVGKEIPIAMDKKTGEICRNEIVLEYNDISLLIVGVCLLLLENYSYANKKRRYKERKEREMEGDNL